VGAITVAVSNTTEPVDYFGSRKVVFGTITMSSNYQAGGDTFTLSQFGLEELSYLDIGPTAVNGTPNSYVLSVAYPNATGGAANGAILAFGSSNTSGAAFPQVANNTNLSAYTAQFMAIGW